MRVIPAVDLRDGACVQLVGGSYADERVRLPDPVAVTASWFDAGYDSVHVVDLDAATGRGGNEGLVDDLLARWPHRISVGGGVRTTARAVGLVERGAARVVVGTRALDDPPWLAELATRLPKLVVLALDLQTDTVLADGWRRGVPTSPEDVLDSVAGLPLAGLLVTAVHREGALVGADLELMQRLRGRTRHLLIASGGIRHPVDVAALADVGVEECVVGMAMYTGGFQGVAP